MITNTTNRSVESTLPVLDEASYSFDEKNMKHIASILREMYSDPLMAVVREYSANALDAHVLAGTPDIPIEITVPTVENPTLIIRDFGNGLSDDEVKALLLGYGASGDHKRQSNSFVGGFGIGAKSAFAITDQFTFVSHHEGKCSIWLAYRDEDDNCRAKKVSEKEAETSGISVQIPVTKDQCFPIWKAIGKAFRFYNVKPRLINAPMSLQAVYNKPVPSSTFQGSLSVSSKNGNKTKMSWKILSEYDSFFKHLENSGLGNPSSGYRYRSEDPDTSFVVMGQVAYPIEFGKFEADPVKGLIIEAPVGSLQLAPSRETLSYTQRVKDTLKGVIQAILSSLEADIVDKVKKANDAFQLFQMLKVAEDSLPAEVRRALDGKTMKDLLASRGLNWSGFQVNNTQVESLVRGEFATGWARRVGSYRTVKASRIFPKDDVATHTIGRYSKIVLLTHKGEKVPRYPNELIQLVGSKVYPKFEENGINLFELNIPSFNVMVCSEDNVPTIPWINDPHIIRVKAEDLPEEPDEEWVTNTTVKERTRSSGGSSNRQTYSQHSKKFSKLSGVVPSYGGVKSSHWSAVDAKTLKDKDQLVYVLHDRFVPKILDVNQSTTFGYDVYETGNYLKNLKGFENFDGIYGIRVRDKQWAAEQKGLILIEDYVNQSLDRILKEYDLTREQFETGFTLFRMSAAGNGRGFIPFIVGATLHETKRIDELDRLISPLYAMAREPVVSQFFRMLCFTKLGRITAQRWFGPFPWEHSGRGSSYKVVQEVDLGKKPHLNELWQVINRCQKTGVRRNLVESVDPLVSSHPHEIKNLIRVDQAKKYYQLLLSLEELDL